MPSFTDAQLWSSAAAAPPAQQGPRRYADTDLWGHAQPGAAPPAHLKADEGNGFLYGLMHPIDNMAGWAEQGVRAIPGGSTVADWIDNAGHAAGLPSNAQATHQRDQFVAQLPTHGKKLGALGQIAGNTVATLPIMMATGNPMIGGAISGAASTKDPHSLKGVTTDAAVGAVTGKVGDMAANAIGRVVSPQLRAPVQTLVDNGVQLTPGQIMGGSAKTIEDASTHLPIVGQLVKNAQRQSVQTFNRAMINRSLQPIGEQLPEGMNAGRQAVDYAATKLGNAFEAAKPSAPVALDDGFNHMLADAVSGARILPTQKQVQLANILQSTLGDRVGTISGAGESPFGVPSRFFDPDAVQIADRELGKMASSYGGSQDPDQQALGRILGGVQDGFRDTVARQDPGYAADIGAAREGWSNFVPIRNAASGVGAKEGVFTPSQMALGLRRADSSVGKGAFATGGVGGQDVVDAAQSVLPSSVPDSGTAARGLVDILALGMLGGGEHALHIHPATLAPLAAFAGAYTPPGLAAGRYLLSGSRPAAAKGLADAIDQFGRPLFAAGSSATGSAYQGGYLQDPQVAQGAAQ